MNDEQLKEEFKNTKFLICCEWFSLAFILILIFFMVHGCATIGTADKPTMMNKWRDKPVTENLLADINGWGNWYKKSNPLEPGNCVPQTTVKANILKELGIPYKIVHCIIVRDAYNSVGHRFLIAQLNNEWMVMDNGAVQDVVWEYEAVKRSTFGIENYQVEE